MLRGVGIATLAVVTCAASGQQSGVLHVRVVLAETSGRMAPVAGHTLLVSDLPPSAPPRRITTAPDGTVSLNLPSGPYIVESDRPVVFDGRTYSWAETIEVPAGGRASLELSATNARSASGAPAVPPPADHEPEADPTSLLVRWAPSVVAVWTPTTYASALVLDGRGLIATSQRAVGSARSVEVQVTPSLKVEGRVLLADPAQELAVVRLAPSVLATADSAADPCAHPAAPTVAVGEDVHAIGLPLHGQPDVISGAVRSVAPQAILADIRLAPATAGGPVFTAAGSLAGISSAADPRDERLAGTVRIIRIDRACDAVRRLEPQIAEAPPDATPLPAEPDRPFPQDHLAELAAKRAGRIPPTARSSGFEIAFITPVDVYAALRQANSRVMDFSNWSDYVAETPPVLLVRSTPRQVESFWVTLARGAAWTQGARLPPIKHFTAGFARLRAFCGPAEVIPIHRFKLELRLSETEGTWEGLSVFDPGALGPHCGRVRFELFSDDAPDEADTVDVDRGVLDRVWQDFEAYRALP
jgi:S1-C subfamily serine protease